MATISEIRITVTTALRESVNAFRIGSNNENITVNSIVAKAKVALKCRLRNFGISSSAFRYAGLSIIFQPMMPVYIMRTPSVVIAIEMDNPVNAPPRATVLTG